MSTPVSQAKRLRARILAAVILAGAASAFLGAGSESALALCKYGTPHCVNPNPGPKLPTVGGAKLPDSGWVDPECQYYNDCNFTVPAQRQGTVGFQAPGKLLVK